MTTTELRACMEQTDSKEAVALLRKKLRSRMREALTELSFMFSTLTLPIVYEYQSL
jgi:hypothetical protein